MLHKVVSCDGAMNNRAIGDCVLIACENTVDCYGSSGGRTYASGRTLTSICSSYNSVGLHV